MHGQTASPLDPTGGLLSPSCTFKNAPACLGSIALTSTKVNHANKTTISKITTAKLHSRCIHISLVLHFHNFYHMKVNGLLWPVYCQHSINNMLQQQHGTKQACSISLWYIEAHMYSLAGNHYSKCSRKQH